MRKNKTENIYPSAQEEKWGDNERNFYRATYPRNSESSLELTGTDESDLVTREESMKSMGCTERRTQVREAGEWWSSTGCRAVGRVECDESLQRNCTNLNPKCVGEAKTFGVKRFLRHSHLSTATAGEYSHR